MKYIQIQKPQDSTPTQILQKIYTNKKRHPNGCPFWRYRPNLFAFFLIEKIIVRLGPALAGSAHPRRIEIFKSDKTIKKEEPEWVLLFGGTGQI